MHKKYIAKLTWYSQKILSKRKKNMNEANIVLNQYKESGYYQGFKLNNSDLEIAREMVKQNWRNHLCKNHPELGNTITTRN